jgi:hypothetical protein
MLAVAFNGLARRNMKGSIQPGTDVAKMAANLRGLADALDAFDSCRPGTYFDADELRRKVAGSEEAEAAT